ncbi:MAG TPA: TPM domain-containing protein, partial [Candidatus Saccharimonadia bacterium]|nr:TPM domain-containing protein [Candidatus Saccharimonadia bacterium]
MRTRQRARSRAHRAIVLTVAIGWLLVAAGAALAAGPPFPAPVPGVVLYDEAGIFSDATKAEATQVIEAIEARTGAEVVVYTQTKPGADADIAAADGQALGDQWGVGRDGFDDGL